MWTWLLVYGIIIAAAQDETTASTTIPDTSELETTEDEGAEMSTEPSELPICYPFTIEVDPPWAEPLPVANVSFWDGMQFRVSAKFDNGTVIGNVTQSRDFNGDLLSHFSEVLEILSPAGGNFTATIGIPEVSGDPIECKMILGPYDNQYIYVRGEDSYFDYAVQYGGGSPAFGEYYTIGENEIHLRADGHRGFPPSMNWFDLKTGNPSNLASDPSMMFPPPINPKYQPPKPGNLTTEEEFLAMLDKYGQAPGGHSRYWVVGNFTNPIPRFDQEFGETLPYGTGTMMFQKGDGTWKSTNADATNRAFWISRYASVEPLYIVGIPRSNYQLSTSSPKFVCGAGVIALALLM